MLGLKHFKVVHLHFECWSLLVHSVRRGYRVLLSRRLAIRFQFVSRRRHSRRPDELPAINPGVLELLYDLILLYTIIILAIVYFIYLLPCQLCFLELIFKVLSCIFRYFGHEIACLLFLQQSVPVNIAKELMPHDFLSSFVARLGTEPSGRITI